MAKKLKILIVEDNDQRVRLFAAMLDLAKVHLVHAASGGQALGILQRDRNVYDGVMMDHDLAESTRTESDLGLSGRNVVRAVIHSQAIRKPPVLIHSMNPVGAASMEAELERAWFPVDCTPYAELTKERLVAWVAGLTDDESA
jgi:CheY-like chemotaxis protein